MQGANVATGVYVNTFTYHYVYIPAYLCMHCNVSRKRRERVSLHVCT